MCAACVQEPFATAQPNRCHLDSISGRSCCSSLPGATQVVLEEERLLVYSGSDAAIVGGSNSLFFFLLSPPVFFFLSCLSRLLALPLLSRTWTLLSLHCRDLPARQESSAARPPGDLGHVPRPITLGRAFGYGWQRAPGGAAGRGCHAAGQAHRLAAARRTMSEAAELGWRRGHHPQQRPQEAQLHLPDGAAPPLHLGAR